jgi:hypothetical protein
MYNRFEYGSKSVHVMGLALSVMDKIKFLSLNIYIILFYNYAPFEDDFLEFVFHKNFFHKCYIDVV